MHIGNDYSEAVPVERALYAVRLRDGGWGVADGPGTQLLLPDELAQAGYHLPVRFNTLEAARQAIQTGPEAPFDIKPNSRWVKHAISAGGVWHHEYQPASGPEDTTSRSG